MALTTSYWPADTSEPVLDTTVGQILREAAAATPDTTALVAGFAEPSERRRWTYAGLLAGAEAVARALLTRFQPGERVAVWWPNLPEWVHLEFGAALAGVVLVTVNPAYREKELEFVLRQSRASGLFLIPEFRGNPMRASLEAVRANLPELREVVELGEWADFLAGGSTDATFPEVSPDDAVQIQYTSGTTGFPKGAVLRHRGITNNARLTMQRFGARPGDVYAHAMPMFHTAGCVLSTLGPTQCGGTQVLGHVFEPGLLLELAEVERANLLLAVPTMLIALMEHPDFKSRDLSSLRIVTSGGATVPGELVRRVESELGARFSIVFGQTETSPVITQTRPDDSAEDKADTIGQALPQTEVQIVDPATGQTVPIGEMGELCTRGYLVMKEYFDLPDRTGETIDAEGWLHTGDLCSMDERGYCRVEGRLKDMIIRGGENIYPREIEELLMTHPKVAEAAVVGLPDERWGELVAAFIRPAAGEQVGDEELFAFCRERLAPYKTPRCWVTVDTFPMTPSGKIQKYVLRQQYLASAPAPAPAPAVTT